MSRTELADVLLQLEGRGYPAYKEIRGAWQLGAGSLFVDHVQGDPFAAPSRLRFRLPLGAARVPEELLTSRTRRLALCDFLARAASHELAGGAEARSGSGRSGSVRVDAGGQEVLERSAVVLGDDFVELRLEVGLPARGRRILGRAAGELLTRTASQGATRALQRAHAEPAEALRFVDCIDNQEAVRGLLPGLGLIAFVANGSHLARESGASDRPLTGPETVAFRSPASLEVEVPLPNPDPQTGRRELVGMGVPRGVTLIVGGGYHGKSTLLRAIERGVYPHVPGDGREGVVSDPSLVKIRAEDGRRVAAVDIHGFVGRLPGGRDTHCFTSEDASGSTSQAAGIVEAIEAGASGLLLDEDTCASNFMVRDARMQALVAREHEPITPFIDRVRELHETLGISSLLVVGGSGDYFDVADRVIAMRDYTAFEVSAEAQQVAAEIGTQRVREVREALLPGAPRVPDASSLDASRGRRSVRLDVPERDLVLYGEQRLELRGLEQLVDHSQTRAIARAVHLASQQIMSSQTSLDETLDLLDALLEREGLDALAPAGATDGRHPGNLARPRRFEIAGALNRLRGVRWRSAR